MKIAAIEFPCLWAEYMNNGEFEKVVALYHDRATLLPTYSPLFIKDAVGVKEYFDRLQKAPQLKVRLDRDVMTSIPINDQNYVVSGFYSFDFVEAGKVKQHLSRYTFVIDLALAKPILHHHSSGLPADQGTEDKKTGE